MKKIKLIIIMMLLSASLMAKEKHYIYKSVGATFHTKGVSMYLDKRSYRKGNYGFMIGLFDNKKYTTQEWNEQTLGFNASMYLLMPEFLGFSIPVGVGAKSVYVYFDNAEGVYYKDDRAITGFIHTGLIKEFQLSSRIGFEFRGDFFIGKYEVVPNIGIGIRLY